MNAIRVRNVLILALCFGITCGHGPWLLAQSSSPPSLATLEERLERLEQTLEAVETRLDQLEKRSLDSSTSGAVREISAAVADLKRQGDTLTTPLQPQAQTPGTPAAPKPATVEAGSNGFWLQSADGNFRLRPRFTLNADGRFATAGTKLSNFFLRRAQPLLEGTLFHHLEFKLQAGFTEGQGVLNDAYMDFVLSDGLKVRAGKFKSPIGLERLMSGAVLPIMERSVVSQLIPNRDLGMMLYGEPWNRGLEYAAGIFNGIPDGASGDSDRDQHKDFIGRLFLRPFSFQPTEPPADLGIGIAASIGSRTGTASSPALPSYKTTGERSFFGFLSDGTAAGTVLADGQQRRLVPQAYFYWKSLGLLSEYAVSSMDVRKGSSRATLDHTAWQITASYLLTGDKASYEGVSPLKPFDPKLRQWGAWELAARYGTLRVDPSAFPLFAGPEMAESAKAWAIGLNWYLNKIAKIALNYEQTHFSHAQPRQGPENEKLFLERLQLRF